MLGSSASITLSHPLVVPVADVGTIVCFAVPRFPHQCLDLIRMIHVYDFF